jgi:hypothetical protein
MVNVSDGFCRALSFYSTKKYAPALLSNPIPTQFLDKTGFPMTLDPLRRRVTKDIKEADIGKSGAANCSAIPWPT